VHAKGRSACAVSCCSTLLSIADKKQIRVEDRKQEIYSYASDYNDAELLIRHFPSKAAPHVPVDFEVKLLIT